MPHHAPAEPESAPIGVGAYRHTLQKCPHNEQSKTKSQPGQWMDERGWKNVQGQITAAGSNDDESTSWSRVETRRRQQSAIYLCGATGSPTSGVLSLMPVARHARFYHAMAPLSPNPPYLKIPCHLNILTSPHVKHVNTLTGTFIFCLV